MHLLCDGLQIYRGRTSTTLLRVVHGNRKQKQAKQATVVTVTVFVCTYDWTHAQISSKSIARCTCNPYVTCTAKHIFHRKVLSARFVFVVVVQSNMAEKKTRVSAVHVVSAPPASTRTSLAGFMKLGGGAEIIILSCVDSRDKANLASVSTAAKSAVFAPKLKELTQLQIKRAEYEHFDPAHWYELLVHRDARPTEAHVRDQTEQWSCRRKVLADQILALQRKVYDRYKPKPFAEIEKINRDWDSPSPLLASHVASRLDKRHTITALSHSP